MTKIPDVVPSTKITDEWGNGIRDQTVQRYDSAADRTANHGTAQSGQVTYLADTGALQLFHGSAWRDLMPTGVVLPFGGSAAPSGFALCNGGAVSRTTYADLFAVIGTTFGAGNGTTTFNLPDMRGRFPFGKDTSGVGADLGETFGEKNHRHTQPNHTHTAEHRHTVNPPTTSTTSNGNHTHSVPNTNSGGSHSHSFSDSFTTSQSTLAGSVGAGISGSGLQHTHTGSVSGTTGGGGSHSHSIDDTGSAGVHSHNVDIEAFFSADATPTTSASGDDLTGSNNPPALTLNFIIKL